MRLMIMAALIGVSGCNVATSDAAFCGYAYTSQIDRLARAIEADPTVSDDVGEAATNVILGHDAGCK